MLIIMRKAQYRSARHADSCSPCTCPEYHFPSDQDVCRLDLHTQHPWCCVTQGHTASRILLSTRLSNKCQLEACRGSCLQLHDMSAPKDVVLSKSCNELLRGPDESHSMIGVLLQSRFVTLEHQIDARNAEGPPDTAKPCCKQPSELLILRPALADHLYLEFCRVPWRAVNCR